MTFRRVLVIANIVVLALVLAGVAYIYLTPLEDTAAVDPVGVPTDTPRLEIEVAGTVNGTIEIALRPDVAPQHVAQVVALAEAGAYDNVVFHRVIEGFMAQTGDVQFGVAGGNLERAGMGGSDRADLPAEFSNLAFERGVVGMARSQSPDSANSQFFIMFDRASNLDGQYTVIGRVTSGMDVVDAIKRGEGPNGAVLGDPDVMTAVRVRGE